MEDFMMMASIHMMGKVKLAVVRDWVVIAMSKIMDI
jgi:hypothetical protein